MRKLFAALLLMFVCLAGASLADEARTLRLATTTSTHNSGLLDEIMPVFEKEYGVKVHVIPVGTGKALKLGENGDVDIVMVHAPDAEMRFVEAGFGVNRRPFMKNDFVIVGPKSDSAGIKKAEDLEKALKKISKDKDSVFISRGDDSGTHKKERKLWEDAGIDPRGDDYLEIGQGMGAALRMAHEKEAYTLSDRGTYLSLKDTIDSVILFEGDERLDNPYAVIAVNPARWPESNYMDAVLLIGWLTSPEGQKMIGEFKARGEVLFKPTAIPKDKR